MPAVIVVRKYHISVRVLPFLPLEACTVPSGTMFECLCLNCMVSSAMEMYFPQTGATRYNSSSMQCLVLRVSWITLTNNLEESFS